MWETDITSDVVLADLVDHQFVLNCVLTNIKDHRSVRVHLFPVELLIVVEESHISIVFFVVRFPEL